MNNFIIWVSMVLMQSVILYLVYQLSIYLDDEFRNTLISFIGNLALSGAIILWLFAAVLRPILVLRGDE